MAFLLAAMTVFGGLMVAVRPAAAPFQSLVVTPGLYGHPGLPRYPYLYTPNETVTFTVTGSVAGEQFDVLVYPDPTPANSFRQYNNVTIPTTPFSVPLTFTVPQGLADGANYAISVYDPMYIENGFVGVRFARQFFAVQQYELRVEVDRRAYIGGDKVFVTWSANNLRDGALATCPSQCFGQVWAYSTSGVFFAWPGGSNVFTVPNGAASGIANFTLPDPGDPRFNGIIFAWFNDTTATPTRFQQAGTTFGIDSLSAIVAVAAPKVFAPGGIVTTTITTVATPNPAAPSPADPPEPGMNVGITVLQNSPSGPITTTYGTGTSTLQTDAHGRLVYVFQLSATAAQATYEVHVVASNPSGILQWNNSFDTFSVTAAAGITQVLQFERHTPSGTWVASNDYQAGDTVRVTSILTGAGGATVTYIFEVRDTTSAACTAAGFPGTLLAKSTQATNQYQYLIDPNFSGQVCFRVTANAGQGSPVMGVRAFTVVFGWLLVNANPQQYNPGDTVAVSWDLVSNRIQNPQYYYEVRDSDGNLVASGSTNTARSLNYPIPSPSSTRYTFTVTATELGRTVAGSIAVTQVTGFFLQFTLDRGSATYAAGDTVTIHYVISPRSANSVAPATYRITYGILNGPSRTVSTGNAQGDLTYTVPQGVDEGPQLFQVAESNTGTSAIEVVTIGSVNPLASPLGDVQAISWILLFLIIVIFLMMWRRGILGGAGAPRPPAPPSGPTKPEPVHAPPTSPMTVTCRSCGSPIEITTSKRPIEVMCPKCGNTEVVS